MNGKPISVRKSVNMTGDFDIYEENLLAKRLLQKGTHKLRIKFNGRPLNVDKIYIQEAINTPTDTSVTQAEPTPETKPVNKPNPLTTLIEGILEPKPKPEPSTENTNTNVKDDNGSATYGGRIIRPSDRPARNSERAKRTDDRPARS